MTASARVNWWTLSFTPQGGAVPPRAMELPIPTAGKEKERLGGPDKPHPSILDMLKSTRTKFEANRR